MSATLIRHGYFPREHRELLALLARGLPAESWLRACRMGAYPGADLLLVFDWLDQRVRLIVFASAFRERYQRSNADVVEATLRRIALQKARAATPPPYVYLGDPELAELLNRRFSSSRGW